jgi:hypothetical protein
MNFIEQLFGISPDGGSGSFEFLLFVVPIALLLLRAAWRRSKRQKSQRNPSDE